MEMFQIMVMFGTFGTQLKSDYITYAFVAEIHIIIKNQIKLRSIYDPVKQHST